MLSSSMRNVCLLVGVVCLESGDDDELVERNLVDHCDADIHASELCPVEPQTIFQQLTF